MLEHVCYQTCDVILDLLCPFGLLIGLRLVMN
uniref:Uncharacterized protein n=1 Tax=Arundo donax TaxID=35708 RepID=A0A0A8ZD84_ARUDO